MAQDDTKRDDDSKDAEDGTKPSEAPEKGSSPPAKTSTPPEEKKASTPPEEKKASAPPEEKKASAPPEEKKASAPPPAAEAAEEEEEDDESEDPDEEGEDEEEEEAPEPEPAKKAAPAKAAPKSAPAKRAEPAAPGVRKRAPLPPEPPPIAVGKTVTLFVVIIGALSAGFWFLGGETGGDRTAPRWKTGQTVDVNITLVAGDRNDLACATEIAIADRKCEYQTKAKPTEPKPEDPMLLKPYTTTDGVQFLAAGLWSQPDLDPKKLPADRFSVKCKFTVEGEVKKPAVRWAVRGGFSDKDNAWYAGTVKDCALSP